MPETVFLQVIHLGLASSGMVLVITMYFYFSYLSCQKDLNRISHRCVVSENYLQGLDSNSILTELAVLLSKITYLLSITRLDTCDEKMYSPKTVNQKSFNEADNFVHTLNLAPAIILKFAVPGCAAACLNIPVINL